MIIFIEKYMNKNNYSLIIKKKLSGNNNVFCILIYKKKLETIISQFISFFIQLL